MMSSRARTVAFAIANMLVLLLAVIGSINFGIPAGRAFYVVTLFALCSAPLLLLDSFHGRYALLTVFMVMYFVFFGALDLLTLIFGPAAEAAAVPGFLSPGEQGILLGGLLVTLGYAVAIRLTPDSSRRVLTDWPTGTIVVVGTALWLIGSFSLLYFQVFVLDEKTNVAAQRGLASLGSVNTFMVLLGNLVQPLGILLLAYGYARFRTTAWLVIVLTVVLVQVAIGFVADIKSSAMLAGILVILTRTFVDNRLPKAWIAGGLVLLALAFPVFQAYRSQVTGERGLTRSEAFQQLDKVIEIALASRDKVATGPDRSQTFFERASLKENVELAFAHTGVDVPFQAGHTLLEVPLAFIPRLLWPNKPGTPTGQLFNKAFIRGGDPDTYISPSHLGEIYWNFGWPGVIVGMTAIGALLGIVGKRTSLSSGVSLTRLLVLIATIKCVCIEFEGAVGVAYVIWLRSLGAIGILHWLFARRVLKSTGQESPRESARESPQPGMAMLPQAQAVSQAPVVPQIARFPNLMR